MFRVKARIKSGAIKSERIAYIKTACGTSTEVILCTTQTGHNNIQAAEIARDKDDVLIELPQEASSGQWRIWVNRNQIIDT